MVIQPSVSLEQPQYKHDDRFDALQAVVRLWNNPTLTDRITIEARLNRRGRKWAIVLEEDWPFDEKPLTEGNLLEERVNWCIEKLRDWPGCNRMAYDQFWFDKKEEAEKFITLYTLTWR